MIFDCFTFFNELELLEIRCEELKELDVIHVVVESNLTHSGKSKPLYFSENKSRKCGKSASVSRRWKTCSFN